MTITLTANMKAKVIKLSGGKTRTLPARTETLTQDDAGRWTIDFDGRAEPITEAEAIDVLSKSTDWESIRRTHFPMHGFHA